MRLPPNVIQRDRGAQGRLWVSRQHPAEICRQRTRTGEPVDVALRQHRVVPALQSGRFPLAAIDGRVRLALIR
jgi:hypothetical protein